MKATRDARAFAEAVERAAGQVVDQLVAEFPDLRDPGARGEVARVRHRLGSIFESARSLRADLEDPP